MSTATEEPVHDQATASDSDDSDHHHEEDIKMEEEKSVGSSKTMTKAGKGSKAGKKGDTGSDKKELKQACARCRQIKVRCQPDGAETDKCARCYRLDLECTWLEPQKRGRKPKNRRGSQASTVPPAAPPSTAAPASKTVPQAQSQPQPPPPVQPPAPAGPPLDALALLAATAAPPGALGSFPLPGLSSAVASLAPVAGPLPPVSLPTISLAPTLVPPPPPPQPHYHQPTLSLPLPSPSVLASTSRAPLPVHATIAASQPSLTSPATTSSRSGAFTYDSPNSLLDTASPRPTLPSLSLMEVAQAKEAALASLSNGNAGASAAPRLARETVLREPDPIDMHILSELEAEQLFNHFHSTLNKFVILLDLHLHKVDYVRRTSTVLFTAILAVSAKFFRPDLYPSLLASSRQLIGRAIVDGKASVGLIQAILISTYWKESSDCSAWMRIGLAIRMGYQLNLHAQRTGPLPPNEFEARILLDRERTWIVLVAFDHTYPLQHGDDEDGFHQTCMIPHYRINLEAWLEETRPYGVTDDLEQAANFEWIKVTRLSRDIARARPAHARALATHLQGMLDATYSRYLDRNSPHSLAFKQHAAEKVEFFWYAASVSIHRALLVAVGTDGVALADWVRASSSFVDAFEAIAKQGLVPYWQDTLALSCFAFGEFAVKIFNKVYPHNQTSMLSWMERIYRACEIASQGKDDSTAAFISRFFQLCIRTVCAPPPGDTAVAAGVAAMPAPHPSSQPPTSASPPTLASLTAQGQPTYGSLPTPSGSAFGTLDPSFSTFSSMGLDANYWESLFPGHSTDWSWLDQPTEDFMRT